MTRPPRNVGASVRARLLTLARSKGEDYNAVLSRYAAERLLFRLAASEHRDRFVLKGAMLFAVWGGSPHRATRDVDLLGFGDAAPAAVAAAMRTVCTTAVADDGVVFDPQRVAAQEIRALDEYGGVRVSLRASVGGALVSVQVDVGFGDAVTPGSVDERFPTLLDFPAPVLRTYPRETVVAEKLEAIVKLGALNTRLKDHYDLWYLAMHFAFAGAALQDAARATFARRGTALPTHEPFGLSAAFAADTAKSALWRAFLGRSRLAAGPPSLPDVVGFVAAFAGPFLAEGAEAYEAVWPAGGPWSRPGGAREG